MPRFSQVAGMSSSAPLVLGHGPGRMPWKPMHVTRKNMGTKKAHGQLKIIFLSFGHRDAPDGTFIPQALGFWQLVIPSAGDHGSCRSVAWCVSQSQQAVLLLQPVVATSVGHLQSPLRQFFRSYYALWSVAKRPMSH